jgi:hypothetical protein
MGVLVAATLDCQLRHSICAHSPNSRRYRTTALGMSVQFRHNDSPKVRRVLERPTLALSRLTY